MWTCSMKAVGFLTLICFLIELRIGACGELLIEVFVEPFPGVARPGGARRCGGLAGEAGVPWARWPGAQRWRLSGLRRIPMLNKNIGACGWLLNSVEFPLK